jgi:hypothetical protein
MSKVKCLTAKQAYFAMYIYLEKLYRNTNSENLAGFLGSMSLLDDGTTADPAVWQDWMESISKAIQASDNDFKLSLS